MFEKKELDGELKEKLKRFVYDVDSLKIAFEQAGIKYLYFLFLFVFVRTLAFPQ